LKCRLTKPLSGWQVMCAWQADLAAIFYLGGTIIQGMIVMNYPSYDFQRWQGTLLLYAVIVIGVAFNTIFARLLPWVEGTILITHCVGFIVVLVPLVYLGPHATAGDVFAKYLTLGNYSPGLSFFVGLITTVFGFLGMLKSGCP
jgi:choline transport protein